MNGARMARRDGGRGCGRSARVRGFSIIELSVVVAVAAILLVMAVPSFTLVAERNRLRNVVERLRSDVTLAKTESLRRDRSVVLSFTRSGDGATWCYGLTTSASCDCTATSGSTVCELDPGVSTVVRSSETRGIASAAVPFTAGNLLFYAARSTLSDGSARFTSPHGYEARVVVTPAGRVRLCSPAGTSNLNYFSDC